MAKKFMLGIEGRSESGATQGIGYNITFEGNEADRGFQSANFNKWRKQVTEIVLRHRDDVFDAAKGEENARQMVSEILAVSKAKGVLVADDGEVPAIQVSGIDDQNRKKGKKLDIRFSAADSLGSITATDYSVSSAQEINADGSGSISLRSARRSFEFSGRGVAF